MHPIQGVVDQPRGVFARHGEPQFVTKRLDRSTGTGSSPEHASAFPSAPPNIAENQHHHRDQHLPHRCSWS
jgi:hypothetical protein